jgi:K+-transporting ATPase A subunit
VLGPDASEVHGVRAAATLTAFTNALTVALFGLIPGYSVGAAATAVAAVGLVFIARALIGVTPGWRAKRVRLRDLTFLASLIVVFVIQLVSAIELDHNRADMGSLHTICILVVVCFLIAIERAWELVGGPKYYLAGLLWHNRLGTDPEPDDRDEDLAD